MMETRWNRWATNGRSFVPGLLACLGLFLASNAWSVEPTPGPPDDSAPGQLAEDTAAEEKPTAGTATPENPGSTPAREGTSPVLRGLRFDDGTEGKVFRFIERTPKSQTTTGKTAAGKETAGKETAGKQAGAKQRKPAPAARIGPTDKPATTSPPQTISPDVTANSGGQDSGAKSASGESQSGESQSGESLLDEIHAASFQGIVPGNSTEEDVVRMFGDPASRGKNGKANTLTYKLGPFPQVDFHVADGNVGAVVVYLDEPAALDDVIKELNLAEFRSCRIPGSRDIGVGRSFPDRGIQLLYDKKSDSDRIKHVSLEMIAAEPFVLRAAQSAHTDVDQRLMDLRIALRLNPRLAEAHWLAARIHAELGDTDAARQSLRQAVAVKARPEYNLLEAELLGREGKWEQAKQVSRRIVEADATRPLVKARAECLLGDLLTASNQGDAKQAMEHHLAAVRQAKELVAKAPAEATRRSAHKVLVDAHLGAANDIARGQWRQRTEAVNRWLAVAGKHAESYVEQYGADSFLQWSVLRAEVTAHMGLQTDGDPTKVVKRILEYGDLSLKQASGPRQQAYVRRQLGQSLFDAMRVAYARKDYDPTRQWGEKSVAYLEPDSPSTPLSADEHYRLGRALFLIGSCHAHDEAMHEAAVVWYERAIAHLDRPLPTNPEGRLGRHGQRFVTMGVSYWHTGSREESVKLTEQGTRWMEQAVRESGMDKKNLAIPYGNLANMHRSMGHTDKAEALTAKAQQVKAAPPPRR